MSIITYFAFVDRIRYREEYPSELELIDTVKEVIEASDLRYHTSPGKVIFTGNGKWIEMTNNKIEAGEGNL